VQAKAQSIHTRLKRTAEDIIAIGQDLTSVKTVLEHGQFMVWAQAEFGMGRQSAQNFMNVSNRFGDKLPMFGNLVSVLYELAAPSTDDAVLYSVGANSTHGLRRTNDDKRRAVETLLNDAEWIKWSDYEIARRTGTSHTFVSLIRPSLATVASERIYTTKQGTVATMNTSNIGLRPQELQQETIPAKQLIEEIMPT
jgi:Protein of unknown function (DUF3102)